MNNSALFSFLRIKFTAEDAAITLAALRQDSLVWQSLEDEQLLFAFLNNKVKDVFELSPARLALISLGCPDAYAGLRERVQFLVGDELQRKANRAFKEFGRSGRQLLNVQEAGLISLALREQWRLSQSWKEVFRNSGMVEAQVGELKNWKTVLVCLFGMIPDGMAMLKSLSELELKGAFPKILVHVVSANPIIADKRLSRYLTLFSRMSLEEAYLSLQGLVVEGHTELAEDLAEAILEQYSNLDEMAASELNLLDSQQLLAHIGRLQTLAGIYQIAGQSSNAACLLRVVEQAAKNWQTGLQMQKFYQSKRMGDTAQLDQKIAQGDQWKQILSQPEASFLPNVTVNLLRVDDQLELHPFLQIRKAECLINIGETGRAKGVAAEAVQQIAELVGGQKDLFAPRFVAEWNPLELVDILAAAGLEAEALQFALVIQQKRPNDAKILQNISERLERSGDLQNAISYAQMAAILAPEQAEGFRKLASLYEKQHGWKEAYESWAQVIRLNEVPDVEDWLGFGSSALKAEMPRIAVKACESALEKDAGNGAANALIGRALRHLDRDADALPHLTTAIQVAPDHADTWLDLAGAYSKLGRQDEALETLQSAYQALPDSTTINHSLGQAFLRGGKAEEALPFFEAAANLNPDSQELAYELGANLFALRKTTQARLFLRKSLEKWPQDVSLAALAAETSLAEGDYASAVPALEVAIQAESASSELKMKYVDALFAGHNPLLAKTGAVQESDLKKSEGVLREVLEEEPFSFAAQLALAEVLGSLGQNQAALELFKPLMETPNVTLPDWRWRLFAGLGVTADALGMPDIALASLKEAAQAAPKRLDVVRKLANAYLNANLSDEAFQAAQTVRSMAPDQVEELIWYASIASQAGYIQEAVEALRCATQFNASQPGLWVELAGLQTRLNDEKGARDSLAKMLELDVACTNDLRHAANLYLSWGDREACAASLLRAASLEEKPSAELLFELACVQAQCGDLAAAEELTRKLVQAFPGNACLYLFQGDLLAALDRPQGALASLQHAESMRTWPTEGFPFDSALVKRVLPENWYQSLLSPEALEFRMGVLLHKLGDGEAALGYLQRALELNPNSAVVRYWAVDQADALLHKEKLIVWLKAIENLEWNEEKISAIPVEEKIAWTALYGMLIDQKIEDGNSMPLVVKMLEKGMLFEAGNSGLLAAKSRCLALSGDGQAARESFLEADKGLWQARNRKVVSTVQIAGFDQTPDTLAATTIRLSKAALEAGDWQNAFRLAEEFKNANPYEPRGLLHFASVIVRLYETQTLYSELKSVRHAPGSFLATSVSKDSFADLIDTLRRLSKSEEIDRWAMRGNMIFHASVEKIRSFAKAAQTAGDITALVAALRRNENYAGAIQISQKNLAIPEVLPEYGLSLRKTLPIKAGEVIRQAISNQPHQPILCAGLALVEQEASRYPEALAALEGGLEKWEDEPEWHAWAAQLAELLQDIDLAAEHWEKACQLMPENLDYVLALANARLRKGDVPQAIQLLEKASKEAEDRAQVWLLLSRSYQQAHAWQDALQAAERAAALDRHSTEPVLQSGKIALALGNHKKAMECANLALKRAPSEPGSILFLCEVQKAAGKFSEALRIVEETINAGKKSSLLFLERAKLIHKMKGAEASAPLLSELSETEADNAEVLGMLAKVQMELGQRHEAGMNACRALKLDPQQPGLHYLIGGLKRAEGHLDQAVYHFSEAVRQYPQDLEAYVALGETHLERRENTQALQVLREAMKIAPEDHRLFSKAGVILREQKDYVGAEELMRRASELAPGDVNIRRQLGAIVALNLVHNPKEVKA